MGSAPNADPLIRNTKTIIPTIQLFFIPIFPPSLNFSDPGIFLVFVGPKQCGIIITNLEENQIVYCKRVGVGGSSISLE
jgi:hypothetical protein